MMSAVAYGRDLLFQTVRRCPDGRGFACVFSQSEGSIGIGLNSNCDNDCT